MAVAVILGIVFFALMVAGFVFGGIMLYQYNDGYNKSKPKMIIGIIGIIVGIAMLVCFILIPFSYHQVDEGEIAVVKHYGEIVDTRESGLHYDLWITNSYEKLDSKVRQVDITTASYSNDKQTMDITMTI